MAQSDLLKRYLDAGMAFTQMTRDRAEAIVKELVKAGEVRRKEAEERVEELLERSRKNTEDLLAIIRREVAEQLRSLGLEDLARRAETLDTGATQTSAPVSTAPASAPAAAKKSTAKKSAAKKTAAKKSAAKKAAAKKQAE